MRKVWSEDVVETELKRCIAELGLKTMPSNTFLIAQGKGPLSGAIQKYGGFVYWANKLGLDYAAKNRFSWDDESIKNGIYESIAELGIDRMPTSNELQSIGKVTLANAISRSKKYKGWAEFLGLDTKISETSVGGFYEKYVKNRLEGMGFQVEGTSNGHPYDFLVDQCVKVDVKAGKERNYNTGFLQTSFGINKLQHTCDIYVCVRLKEDNTVDTMFIIPSHAIKSTTITIGGKSSKYDKFSERWDYISNYAEFFKSQL